ncbi:MAG: BadF/BadG/BcrA/BcrD ATPase family protein [Steroidobacteraceae bacterium]
MFLGVDGGGTKTAYAVIDSDGGLHARHVGPSVSHLADGFAPARDLLADGIGKALALASLSADKIDFAFVGLPAYGEDTASIAKLDAMPASLLRRDHYRCGNDMLCSWAGALGCRDGISVIAGTGSMAYGEYAGRAARCGGWGEIIGDEGSAYWIAREGMNLFSRMSDGRVPRGPLYELVRARWGLSEDLDLCARVYGADANTRSAFAQFAPVVHEAARAGDVQATAVFERAANELFQCVEATRRTLNVPDRVVLPVSHTGGVLNGASSMLEAFRRVLSKAPVRFEYRAPEHAPEIGAALYAARLVGTPLTDAAIRRLRA